MQPSTHPPSENFKRAKVGDFCFFQTPEGWRPAMVSKVRNGDVIEFVSGLSLTPYARDFDRQLSEVASSNRLNRHPSFLAKWMDETYQTLELAENALAKYLKKD